MEETNMSLDPETKSYIETVLTSSLKSSFGELRNYFDTLVTPISQRLDAFEVASVPQETPGELEGVKDDPLSKRLAKLESDLKAASEREAAREAEAQSLRFDKALSGSLTSKGNLVHQGIVSELLSNRLRNGALEKDGEWLTKDGLKLSEAVENFFGTPEGSHFLPSNNVEGSATPTQSFSPGGIKMSRKDVSLDEMMNNMSFN
jgi:hypothetical protein